MTDSPTDTTEIVAQLLEDADVVTDINEVGGTVAVIVSGIGEVDTPITEPLAAEGFYISTISPADADGSLALLLDQLPDSTATEAEANTESSPAIQELRENAGEELEDHVSTLGDEYHWDAATVEQVTKQAQKLIFLLEDHDELSARQDPRALALGMLFCSAELHSDFVSQNRTAEATGTTTGTLRKYTETVEDVILDHFTIDGLDDDFREEYLVGDPSLDDLLRTREEYQIYRLGNATH